jgi:HK97 family phage major capsid protein
MSSLLDRLDPTQTTARDLKAALDVKHAEAKELYATYERARRTAIESKADLSKDAAKLKELEGMRDAYSKSAGEVQDLRDRLDRIMLDLPSKGVAGDTPGEIFAKELERQGVDFKAVISGGSIVPATFDELIRKLPQRQLRLRNLIRMASADADVVSFLQQTVFTNNAAPVALGALKPTTVLTVQRVDQSVQTIAHLSEPIDRALLMDASQLAQFVDDQLILGVLLAEENQIVNGNGTTPNLRGVLNTSGVLTQARGADTGMDAIFKAVTQVRANFFEPTGILIHPTDWQNIRLAKNAQGDYYYGPPNVDGAAELFGVPVAISPVLAVGTAVVADWQQSQLWIREDARVTFAEQGGLGAANAEIFSRNQIVFRGEERAAFGVVRPAAFCSVTGL